MTNKTIKEQIVGILKDWGVENPENLITWLEPIIKKYGEECKQKGRSEIYADLEKMKDNKRLGDSKQYYRRFDDR